VLPALTVTPTELAVTGGSPAGASSVVHSKSPGSVDRMRMAKAPQVAQWMSRTIGWSTTAATIRVPTRPLG